MEPHAGRFDTPSSSKPVTADVEKAQDTFKALKEICVPLLANSRLTVESIPRVSRLLSQLWSLLNTLSGPQPTLSSATVSYVFFPLSHVLQRNPTSSIPDVVMEKVMDVLALLFEQWWWTCPLDVWEQVLMLSAAIFGEIGSGTDAKGKRKGRDEDTKRAAANCLWSVLRRRDKPIAHDALNSHATSKSEERFGEFQARGRASKLLPVFGQTLTALLDAAQSVNRELRMTSLHIIHAMIVDYLPDAFMPSILPGVISAMVKVALGLREGKGWSNGDTVSLALKVMQETIVRAIGDEVCQSDGAVRTISDLEDLADGFDLNGSPTPDVLQTPASPFFIQRTSVWLTANASQLHIALNTLSPLRSHPNPVALNALSRFAQAVASNTNQTLQDTQPFLLSLLLSLSTSSFPDVADTSTRYLLMLLTPPSTARFTHLQVLIRITQENLSALPRVIPSHNDSKVEHLARQISGVCRLAKDVRAVSDGVGKLLGPGGGIEKWGWSLLSALELTEPSLFISTAQPYRTLLESSAESARTYPFPTVRMKYITSPDTRDELDSMLRTLGMAGGSECLFSVEWFVEVAQRGKGTREVAALWCATKILEGVGGVSLDTIPNLRQSATKRAEKVARWTAKVVAEFWDQQEEDHVGHSPGNGNTAFDDPGNDGYLPLEYAKGIDPLITLFDSRSGHRPSRSSQSSQRILHSVVSLHLLSVTSAILQSKFARLLLYTLYPVLRSIVSENSYLSSTALAALHFITASTSYASPSNLLLANFDYALDGVTRRLDRRHLDPEATKILVLLVRLVGKEIVSRAGDVVEACFDRLDEFHGYNTLVEGLVEVLAEVVKVVEADSDEFKNVTVNESVPEEPLKNLEAFLQWYQHRHDQEEKDQEDYGPAPRTAWGSGVGNDREAEMLSLSNSGGPDQEPPSTPTQVLTQQIVERSIYFLTHPSPLIRARILNLLDTACPTLYETALLPSIHTAWPYVLNRLADSEPFVVSAAASLIASLAENVGEFMTTRIWNDVWPRFRKILSKLEAADSQSALARRDRKAVGTESAYTHSHRLYVSLLRTMCAVVKGVELRHDILWEVLMAFRRFLHSGTHEELQLRSRKLYGALMTGNGDAVWLVLSATAGKDELGSYDGGFLPASFLTENKWDIKANARKVVGLL